MNAVEITPLMTIAELQEAFHGTFPFLKLDLYRLGESLNAMQTGRALSEISALRRPFAPVRLHAYLSVADCCELLWTQCGLQADIMRRSGYTWIDTQLTSNWTLEHQNEKGKQISMALR
jgi:hypothetical protein